MKTRIIQFFIIILPFTLFFWLIWIDIAPSGIKTVVYLAGQDSPYINHLLPSERVEYPDQNKKSESFVRIKGEPVYFSVDLPRTDFDTVEVGLEFRNNQQPILELGALVDPVSDAYDLRPIQNIIIEESDWSLVEDGNIILLDRAGLETSVFDFLDNPELDKLATYNFELNIPYREPNYQALGYTRVVKTSLRGHHQYATYIKNEVLSLDLTYSDVNRTLGADEVVVRVFNEQDEVVFEEKKNDDQNTTENQEDSKHSISIRLPNLPEGVYRVELSGTSDIFWRILASSQRYMSFVDRVYLGDSVGYEDGLHASNLYTNAKNLSFETAHVEGIQTIKINEKSVDIYTSHKKIDYAIATPGTALIDIPSSDIKITGRGKYALSADAFFEPDPIKLTYNSDLEVLGVNYILAGYSAPQEREGWLANPTSHYTEFNVDEIKQDNGSAKFILSVPGIEDGGWVDLHKITLTFKKDPITFWQFLAELRERLPFGI
ncbi:hypothetical protein KJ758_03435 [Patescibacteria group bacterium]|nr:hypothetical protein [Patescibacteria group bacterium]